MAEIRITLETLYDILRNEKKKEDLQKLEPTFYLDFVQYLQEKKALLESHGQESELFAAGERDKLEYELRSIKRILKEIYERREKKVLDIALNKSRTGSDIIDTSAMLSEEKEFYQQALSILDNFRKGILLNLFQGQLPVTKPTPFTKFEKPPSLLVEGETPLTTTLSTKENPASPPAVTFPAKEEASLPPASGPDQPDSAKIRFIRPVPSFVWKDMKEYGPFDIGESTEIFPAIAELLVRKGRAVKA